MKPYQLTIKPHHLSLVLLAIGVALRLYSLGGIPVGTQFDEAMAGYDAFSLANYGYDSHGDVFTAPIGFGAGNGTYALYTWLAVLPIKIFGATFFALRLPMALLSCLALVIFYDFSRRVANGGGGQTFANVALFLLAINPWELMEARWVFTSNTAIYFGLFGAYFLYRGIEKNYYLPISAVLFGIGLNAFPMTWLIYPGIALLMLGYFAYCRQLKFSAALGAAVAIMALAYVPIVVFNAVKFGWLDEIHTPYYSVPRLLDTKVGASITDFNLVRVLAAYADYYLFRQNCWTIGRQFLDRQYGIFYLFSAPLLLIGVIAATKKLIEHWRRREIYAPAVPLFMVYGCVAMLIFPPHNNLSYHQNLLYIPLIYALAYGIILIGEKLGVLYRNALLALYLVAFLFFAADYFGKPATFPFGGCAETVKVAMQSKFPRIYVMDLEHPQFLFAAQYPTDQLLQDAEWRELNYGSPDKPRIFLRATRIGRFIFPEAIAMPPQIPIDNQSAYVYHQRQQNLSETLKAQGFTLDLREQYIFAYRGESAPTARE